MAMPFDIHARDGAARTGVLRTARGDIRTPAFMPVGTAGDGEGYAAELGAGRPGRTCCWATPTT